MKNEPKQLPPELVEKMYTSIFNYESGVICDHCFIIQYSHSRKLLNQLNDEGQLNEGQLYSFLEFKQLCINTFK